MKNAVTTASIMNGIGINAKSSIAKRIAGYVAVVMRSEKIIKGINAVAEQVDAPLLETQKAGYAA